MGQTSRPKAISPADQDLSAGLDLKLGEMQNVDTLTVSEAALVVNSILAKRAMDNNEPPQLNQVQRQALNFFDAFARYRSREAIEAVERLLSSHQELTKFERAQLGSLCCRDAAKTVIPSLADKISDEKLQELLNELAALSGQDSQL